MKPNITITTQDAERLEILLDSLSSASFPTKNGLEEELDRAVKVEPKNVSPTVVTMNSTVRFELLPSGREHCLKLIYPGGQDVNGVTCRETSDHSNLEGFPTVQVFSILPTEVFGRHVVEA